MKLDELRIMLYGSIKGLKQAKVFVETQRKKVLGNPDDPSWTEHLTEVNIAIDSLIQRIDADLKNK